MQALNYYRRIVFGVFKADRVMETHSARLTCISNIGMHIHLYIRYRGWNTHRHSTN